MNFLIVIIISICALASIISVVFRKRKTKGDFEIKKNEKIEKRNIDNLFDDCFNNDEFEQEIKKEPKVIRVPLKDRIWWRRNHNNFWSWCFIALVVILIAVLSPISHSSYNTQQDISIQIEQQKMLRDNIIQALKDSIRKEQIKIISSKLDSIDVHVKKIKSTTSKVVILNKTIIKK